MNVPHVPDQARVSVDNLAGQWDGSCLVGLRQGFADDQDIPAGLARRAEPRPDPARFLHDELAQASPDLMRELLGTFINALLSAQADAVCGAEYGTRQPGPGQPA